MDFYSLSRKELQALCKKNKIPANITNVAMADALAALPRIEGLDGFLNPVEADAKQFGEEKVMATPDIHHSRTSTRRKDVNVAVVTPAMRSISTRRKKKEAPVADDEKPIDHVPKTPAAAPTTVTRAYNTRRSVRLLEKNLSKMSLVDSADIGLVKFDDVNVSGKTRDSVEAEPHYSKLKLEGSSETCNDSIEVCEGSDLGLNKPIGKEVDADNEAESKLLFEVQDFCDSTEPENKKCIGTMEDAPIQASEDATMEVPNQDIAAFSSSAEVPDDASMEATGQDIVSLLPMSSVSKTDNQGGNDSAELSALSSDESEVACMEVTTDHDVAALTVEVTNTDQDVTALSDEIPGDASMEATGQDIAADSPSMSSVCDDSVTLKELVACNTDNHTEIYDASVLINTLVDSDVIPEEIAIPKQESSISVETTKQNKSPSKVLVDNIDEVSLSTVTVPTIYEQKTNETQIQSIAANQLKGEPYSPAQSEPKCVAYEHIQVDDKKKFDVMKENPLQNMSMGELRKMPKKLTLDGNMSMGELRKMLKKLTLDGKSNTKSSNVAKEMDRKRTALQALPENQMTAGETRSAE